MWSKVLTRSASTVLPGARGLQTRRAVRMWDRVQPSLWHTLASLEQSLMDAMMTRRVFSPRFLPFAPFTPDALPKLHCDDDEFFKDLPIKRPEEAMKEVLEARTPEYSATGAAPEKEGTAAALDKKEPSTGTAGTVPHPSYTSYSYSYSTVLDHGGHRASTTRRRYEDSTGRLKATHERDIDGKKMKMVWQRSNEKDEGGHETLCSSGSPEEFEKDWDETPFGRAEDEELAKWVEDRERSAYQAFGAEYNPGQPMEQLNRNETTPEERKVVEEGGKERKETIQKMSKRQEEETTLPQFS